jgi:hypothetical protein
LAGSKKQAAYATENLSLTFRAGRARPLHRIVVGARHASPGTLESGGGASGLSVFHGVSRAEGPSQQTTRNDGLPHKELSVCIVSIVAGVTRLIPALRGSPETCFP